MQTRIKNWALLQELNVNIYRLQKLQIKFDPKTGKKVSLLLNLELRQPAVENDHFLPWYFKDHQSGAGTLDTGPFLSLMFFIFENTPAVRKPGWFWEKKKMLVTIYRHIQWIYCIKTRKQRGSSIFHFQVEKKGTGAGFKERTWWTAITLGENFKKSTYNYF